MIDRTEFDLRLAAHTATTTRADRGAWRQQGLGRHPVRAALAVALLALAARLDDAALLARRADQALIGSLRG